MSTNNRRLARAKVRNRIRKKIAGTAQRPRLAVHFSNMNVYAQLIDDDNGVTIASASTMDKAVGKKGASVDSATKVGEVVAQRAREAKIETVVFDRGGYQYHGKVKALADAARAAGLNF